MKDKKATEFREKVLEGLKESNQKLIERTKKNKGYLVVSLNNKIEKIYFDSLPEKVSDVKTKYK